MPVFQVDTEKAIGGRPWTNRYLLVAETMLAAQVAGEAIVDIELSVHATAVQFTKWRVSAFGANSPEFVVVPMNATGQRTVADRLPLFNVVRVDLYGGFYDPGRKYLHGCLGEGDQTDGMLTSGARTFFQTQYADPIAQIPGLIIGSGLPPDGQREVTGATVFAEVAMRQLRRGSKRKTTPIIP